MEAAKKKLAEDVKLAQFNNGLLPLGGVPYATVIAKSNDRWVGLVLVVVVVVVDVILAQSLFIIQTPEQDV